MNHATICPITKLDGCATGSADKARATDETRIDTDSRSATSVFHLCFIRGSKPAAAAVSTIVAQSARIAYAAVVFATLVASVGIGQEVSGEAATAPPPAASAPAAEDAPRLIFSGGEARRAKGREEPAESQPGEAPIKVFTLRNIQARDAERIVTQLFAREIQSAAVDERTNSLIVRGPEERLNVIHHILQRLDEPEQGTDQKPNPPSTPGLGRTDSAATAPVGELASRFRAKDRQALELARQIRQLQAGKPDKAQLDQLSADLRRTVGEALAARQELHRAELGQLRERMAAVEQSLKARERLSQEIIDRRVKDVLNPELQWESGPPPPQPAGATGSLTGAAPPALDAAAAGQYRDLLRERYEQLARLYESGRVDGAKLLAAIKELHDAERFAATTHPEYHAAYRLFAERLQKLKALVDEKFKAQVEPEHWKLAVDAELLKAQSATIATVAPASATPAAGATAGNAPVPSAAAALAGSLPPRSARRATFGPEALELCRELGLTVKPLTKEEAPQPPFEGCLKVTALDPFAPDHGFKVGDIIVMLQSRGIGRSGARQIDIEVLRGTERIPMTVALNTAAPAVANPLTLRPAAASTGTAAPGQTPILRPVQEFSDSLRNAEAALHRLRQRDAQGFAGADAAERAKLKEQMVAEAQRRLDMARQEYEAQLRLLAIEVEDAKSALKAAERDFEIADGIYKANRSNGSERNKAQRALEAAKLRLERAETLLDLYGKADPRSSEANDKPE